MIEHINTCGSSSRSQVASLLTREVEMLGSERAPSVQRVKASNQIPLLGKRFTMITSEEQTLPTHLCLTTTHLDFQAILLNFDQKHQVIGHIHSFAPSAATLSLQNFRPSSGAQIHRVATMNLNHNDEKWSRHFWRGSESKRPDYQEKWKVLKQLEQRREASEEVETRQIKLAKIAKSGWNEDEYMERLKEVGLEQERQKLVEQMKWQIEDLKNQLEVLALQDAKCKMLKRKRKGKAEGKANEDKEREAKREKQELGLGVYGASCNLTARFRQSKGD